MNSFYVSSRVPPVSQSRSHFDTPVSQSQPQSQHKQQGRSSKQPNRDDVSTEDEGEAYSDSDDDDEEEDEDDDEDAVNEEEDAVNAACFNPQAVSPSLRAFLNRHSHSNSRNGISTSTSVASNNNSSSNSHNNNDTSSNSNRNINGTSTGMVEDVDTNGTITAAGSVSATAQTVRYRANVAFLDVTIQQLLGIVRCECSAVFPSAFVDPNSDFSSLPRASQSQFQLLLSHLTSLRIAQFSLASCIDRISSQLSLILASEKSKSKSVSQFASQLISHIASDAVENFHRTILVFCLQCVTQTNIQYVQLENLYVAHTISRVHVLATQLISETTPNEGALHSDNHTNDANVLITTKTIVSLIHNVCLLSVLHRNNTTDDEVPEVESTELAREWAILAIAITLGRTDVMLAFASAYDVILATHASPEAFIGSNDSGFLHYHSNLNKDSATKMLRKNASLVGSLLLYPHEGHSCDSAIELSFLSAANEVKHAIVRIQVVIADGSTQGHRRYRCGKTGPFDSLHALLIAIGKVLSMDLLLDRPQIAIQSDSSNSNSNTNEEWRLLCESFLKLPILDGVDTTSSMETIAQQLSMEQHLIRCSLVYRVCVLSVLRQFLTRILHDSKGNSTRNNKSNSTLLTQLRSLITSENTAVHFQIIDRLQSNSSSQHSLHKSHYIHSHNGSETTDNLSVHSNDDVTVDDIILAHKNIKSATKTSNNNAISLLYLAEYIASQLFNSQSIHTRLVKHSISAFCAVKRGSSSSNNSQTSQQNSSDSLLSLDSAGISSIVEASYECFDAVDALQWLTLNHTSANGNKDKLSMIALAAKYGAFESTIGINNSINSNVSSKSHNSNSGHNYNNSKTNSGFKAVSNRRRTLLALKTFLQHKKASVISSLHHLHSKSNSNSNDSNNSRDIDSNVNHNNTEPPIVSSDEHELARKLLDWLVSMRVLEAIVKPPETSFQVTQVFYRYRDAWEAKQSSNINSNKTPEDAITDEIIKFDRHEWYACPKSEQNSGGGLIDDIAKIHKGDFIDRLTHLWKAVNGLKIIENAIQSYVPNSFHDNNAISAASTTSASHCGLLPRLVGTSNNASAYCDYHCWLTTAMLRNTWFAAIGSSLRYSLCFKVSLLALKQQQEQPGSKKTKKASVFHSFFGETDSALHNTSHNNSGNNNSNNSNIYSHSMDVFAGVKIDRHPLFQTSKEPSVALAPVQSNVSISPLKRSNSHQRLSLSIGSSNSRIEQVSSPQLFTQPRKVELAKGSSECEYSFGEHLRFHCALPFRNYSESENESENQCEQEGMLSDQHLHCPLMFAPLDRLTISVVEKGSFFGEKKTLGEIQVDLKQVLTRSKQSRAESDKGVVTTYCDWLPLQTANVSPNNASAESASNDNNNSSKNSSWMLKLRLEMSLPLMLCVD